MKITVITVAFNSRSTLGDALDSVSSQTYPNVEHILIDGGSTDGTMAVVARHGKHLTRFVSEPDKGIYHAMNKGLSMATGDYIGCLNADDMLANAHVLSRIAKAANSGESVGAVFGDLVYVAGNAPDHVIRFWRSGNYERSRLRYGWMPPHPTFYVRRSLVDQIGGFDPNFGIAADYDFILRVLASPDISVRYVPEVLVRMRTGGASNRSISALIRKSQEDLLALRRNKIGGWFTLMCKNLRKLPQFLPHHSYRAFTGHISQWAPDDYRDGVDKR